ncbi:MAG: hypothetical protein NTX24_02270 [Candidatus Pacearchaeota archaeon]|nr:hypothetical protein [Candidatus Pacearchaeota archaeon]
MKREELERKYGKKLIDKIFDKGYLRGCTIAIIDGAQDIPEEDIINAIKEMKDEPIADWD